MLILFTFKQNLKTKIELYVAQINKFYIPTII
jgi:hypothetical protein